MLFLIIRSKFCLKVQTFIFSSECENESTVGSLSPKISKSLVAWKQLGPLPFCICFSSLLLWLNNGAAASFVRAEWKWKVPDLLLLFITQSLFLLLCICISLCSLKMEIWGMLVICWPSGTTVSRVVCMWEKEQLVSWWCTSLPGNRWKDGVETVDSSMLAASASSLCAPAETPLRLSLKRRGSLLRCDSSHTSHRHKRCMWL